MEESKSITENHGDDDFLDAFDEFPFYDCIDTEEQPQSVSPVASISHPEPIDANSDLLPKPELSLSSPTGLRRRRSLSHRASKETSGDDLQNTSPSSSVSKEVNCITTTPRERKTRFSWKLNENEKENVNLDLFKARLSSGSISHDAHEDDKENSTLTTVNNESVIESISVDSRPAQIDEYSSNLLLLLAGLVIKAISFQFHLLISFFTFPIRLLYCSYLLVIDPFRVVRRGRELVIRKLFKYWALMCGNVTPFIYEWLKEHQSFWKLALRVAWGLLWSAYVCFILVGLLVSAFVVSGVLMKYLVEEPIQMKETLNFDYTKNSPVALVPILTCPDAACGVNCKETAAVHVPRVIPPNHKLQVTVSLTLPESDYNRNLGVFQVRVDFLSANGKSLASFRHPCMLKFRSESIRLVSTFLKVAPLMAGYLSESQTLNARFRGFTERDTPTSCLRVTIEQRAEYRPGAGIPEIYAADLTLESELPLFRRFLWYWKKTIYIWTSMMLFGVELLFTLLCCKPIVMPRIRLRNGSARNYSCQSNRRVQR